jgi:hypothetical protein
MRSALAILFGALIVGCERKEVSSDTAKVELQEPKLDELTIGLTKDYENLRPFLHEKIPAEVFEELFRDIRIEFGNRLAVEQKPGIRLTPASINQRGAGMLSLFGDDDKSASVSIVRHSRNRPEVTISKPIVWDRIKLGGAEYVRKCERSLEVYGAEDGISNLLISFGVYATPVSREELVRKHSDCFEYWLVGRYEISPASPTNLILSASAILFHYNPTKEVEQEYAGQKFTGPELLSRVVFNKGDFDLSRTARKHLLQIMDMVTAYGIDQPENAIYKELLSSDTLNLRRARDSW